MVSVAAAVRLAEAYSAIQYNWDSGCSDSESGIDHEDNYRQRKKYLLIDLDGEAFGSKSKPALSKPKRVKKALDKRGRKKKQSVSVHSATETSEGLVISDKQQEEILPRSNCFKRTTLPNRTNDKCLSPLENITHRSFEEELGYHQGMQKFPGIVQNEAMLSDVGDYSLQEQHNPEKTQDERSNPKTAPLGEQHDPMETCVIVLSDSDDEMDEFGNTKSGDGVSCFSEMPEESDNERQILMEEGTTAVTVPHFEQDTKDSKDLVLMETTTRPDGMYSDDDVFVIEPDESCDIETGLSVCNSPKPLPHGTKTLLDCSDGLANGFSSDEETIVQIELQSYVNAATKNQTVTKERSRETQICSLGRPAMTSSVDKTVQNNVSVSVRSTNHKPEETPIQTLKSHSRAKSCSPGKIMGTAKVIQASGYQDDMSSTDKGLSCAGPVWGKRINQTRSQDAQKLLQAYPSIRVDSSDPLSASSDHMTVHTCYEAPQTVQTCDKCHLNFASAELLLKHFSKVHKDERKTFGKRKRPPNIYRMPRIHLMNSTGLLSIQKDRS